jgi:hypothetical protein
MVSWFCDTNLLICPMDQAVWDALLAKRNRLVLAASIYPELKQWLAKPDHNLPVHKAIRLALEGDERSPVRLLDVPRDDPAKRTIHEYYVNLLGLRKKAVFIARHALQNQLVREPTKQELMNYSQDRFGIRGQLLAAKGEDTKIPAHRFNDESLVVTAVMEAIYSGRETTIVTRDEDVLEQFYKLIWLIDTQYRSMLMGDCYAADPLAFSPVYRYTDTHRLGFEGEVILLSKPSEHLEEFLPSYWSPVPVNGILIKNGMMTVFSFCAEQEFRHLFEVKVRTGGLSTDKLDGRNCHVWLGNLAKSWGNRAAIGRDISVGRSEWSYRLSAVDANLALASNEPRTAAKIVDPKVLILPPSYQDRGGSAW